MKKFVHTFSDGTTMTLKVDFSGAIPKFVADKQLDENSKVIEEYRKWQNEVVVPEVMKSLSPRQFANVALVGHSLFGDSL